MKIITKFKIFESLADGKKYQRQIEEKGLDFYTLTRLDPSNNYKYLTLICKYALDGVDFDDIKKYIKAFDLLASKDKIKNKDIYSYKDFDSLKEIVDVVDIKSKGDLIGQIRKERKIILDNDDFLIFIPLTHAASLKYGMGTKWCISMKTDPFYWYALTNSNIIFYFVIVKNKEISDRLFNKFKNDLEPSNLGAQGNIKDESNFEKFVVMSFGKKLIGNTKQIWTKSNHEFTGKNNAFFKELGLNSDLFKNDLPFKSIEIDFLDD